MRLQAAERVQRERRLFGRAERSDIVTIPGLIAGSLVLGPAEVVRAPADGPRQHLIGMDLLSRYCCEFRFAGRLLVRSVVVIRRPGTTDETLTALSGAVLLTP